MKGQLDMIAGSGQHVHDRCTIAGSDENVEVLGIAFNTGVVVKRKRSSHQKLRLCGPQALQRPAVERMGIGHGIFGRCLLDHNVVSATAAGATGSSSTWNGRSGEVLRSNGSAALWTGTCPLVIP